MTAVLRVVKPFRLGYYGDVHKVQNEEAEPLVMRGELLCLISEATQQELEHCGVDAYDYVWKKHYIVLYGTQIWWIDEVDLKRCEIMN